MFLKSCKILLEVARCIGFLIYSKMIENIKQRVVVNKA